MLINNSKDAYVKCEDFEWYQKGILGLFEGYYIIFSLDIFGDFFSSHQYESQKKELYFYSI